MSDQERFYPLCPRCKVPVRSCSSGDTRQAHGHCRECGQIVYAAK